MFTRVYLNCWEIFPNPNMVFWPGHTWAYTLLCRYHYHVSVYTHLPTFVRAWIPFSFINHCTIPAFSSFQPREFAVSIEISSSAYWSSLEESILGLLPEVQNQGSKNSDMTEAKCTTRTWTTPVQYFKTRTRYMDNPNTIFLKHRLDQHWCHR